MAIKIIPKDRSTLTIRLSWSRQVFKNIACKWNQDHAGCSQRTHRRVSRRYGNFLKLLHRGVTLRWWPFASHQRRQKTSRRLLHRNSHSIMWRLSGLGSRRSHPQVLLLKHRDLKPANILRKGNRFKIADFGFSKQMEAKSVFNEKDNKKNASEIKMNTTVGTPLYMPI